VLSRWNYAGAEGKLLELMVFSGAEEVEVLVNGQSIGRKPVCRERPLPCSVRFETVYTPGTVEAISYTNGREVSRAILETSGPAACIRLTPEKTVMKADGHDLIYIGIEVTDQNGKLCPEVEIPLQATVSGPAILAGFGSGNPVTDEDYTDKRTVTFRGRAQMILRTGYEPGRITLKVSGEGTGTAEINLSVNE
jgi:beta-galactosidase